MLTIKTRPSNQSLRTEEQHGGMHAASRLARLLELAEQGPTLRAALAVEVAELLTEWPQDCPMEMRGACEALLARTAREVDDNIRARLQAHLSTDPALAARVLPSGEALSRSLIEIARRDGDVVTSLAEALNLSPIRSRELFSDPSGHALALACKCLQLSRAAFSTLAMFLSRKRDITQYYATLNIYDATNASQAAEQLQIWRTSDAVERAA
jgi:hypothetical protein